MPKTKPNPPELQRQALRAAVKIHQHLAGPASSLADCLPYQTWDLLSRTMARLQVAQKRGWLHASRRVQIDVASYLRRLRYEVDRLDEQWSVPSYGTHRISTPGEIAHDLLALAREFDEVSIDLDEKQITATTEPVVLEGIYVGPFRIELRWSEIGHGSPYDVVAVDAQPANNREDITHPHVSDGHLCEGEGAAAIKAALQSGRLLDFFTLVSQILQTYNAESAHVPLSRWRGEICHDCGYEISEEGSACERCQETVCSDCSTTCQSCARCLCSSCADSCSQCHQTCCSACLANPTDSDGAFCDNCLKPVEECDEPQESNASPEADSVCLGQAAAPA